VLGGRHLFQRRGVDHDVDTAEGQDQAFAVAHVAEEKPHAGQALGLEPLGEVGLDLALLQLVAGQDNQLTGAGPHQDGLDDAQAAIASEGGGEKKKKSGGTSYISLDALSATVIRPDGRRGVLMVETGLDIPDQALRDKAEKLIPRLRAAYFQTVQVYAAGLTP